MGLKIEVWQPVSISSLIGGSNTSIYGNEFT